MTIHKLFFYARKIYRLYKALECLGLTPSHHIDPTTQMAEIYVCIHTLGLPILDFIVGIATANYIGLTPL